MNVTDDVVFKQPRTEAEREAVAEACVVGLDLGMPMVLDEMSNEVDAAYAALPERLYVVDPEGRIAYRSEPGPWGFNMDDWEKAIRDQT
jgi:type I thyroxine 5'-deiodinase